MVRIEYLEQEQLRKLLVSIEQARDRLLVRLLYESGCTISEISELRATAVHPDGTIDFFDRTAHISPELAQELLKQAEQYIFHTRQAPTITPKRIQQILKPYIAAVHKGKITPHVLRYTHIVHAYQAGLSLAAIAEQTGLTAIRLAQIVADIASPKEEYSSFFTNHQSSAKQGQSKGGRG